MSRALVLGVGNILVQDEGIGVRTVEWLQARYEFPAANSNGNSPPAYAQMEKDGILLGQQVEMIDGGTMGLDLLHYLEGIDHLLILDAVHANKTPGAITLLSGDDVPAFFGMKTSPHQIGVQDLLATAQLKGYTPPEVVILGVQPGRLSVGLDMSPEVIAQIEPLAKLALAQLKKWGYAPTVKQ